MGETAQAGAHNVSGHEAIDSEALQWPSRVVSRTWHTETRFYSAVVQCNLFGQWELLRMWGGRGTRLGNSLVEPASSFDMAMALLEREARRRKARRYALTDEVGLH